MAFRLGSRIPATAQRLMDGCSALRGRIAYLRQRRTQICTVEERAVRLAQRTLHRPELECEALWKTVCRCYDQPLPRPIRTIISTPSPMLATQARPCTIQ